MLVLENVKSGYGNIQILQGLSMKAEDGRTAALLGRNGMGKTTAIHTIMGFIPATSGKILLEGRDIVGLQPHVIAGLGVGLVPQGRRIFKSLSVEENLLLGWKPRKRAQEGYDPEDIYRMFPVLKERAKNRGEQISGGEQQMLAIGRALLTNPRLLLMDEPFEGLAPEVIRILSGVIRSLRAAGLSILLVEQNIHHALNLADDVYILSKGRVVFEGTPARVREEEETIRGHMSV